MLKVTLYLRKSKVYVDGRSPLMLRIRDGQAGREVALCRVKESEWDAGNERIRTSHPQHRELNKLVQKRLLEARSAALNASVRGEALDPLAVKNGIKPVPTSFVEHCRFYLSRLEAQGKTHTATKSAVHLRVLAEYLGTTRGGEQKDLSFQQATEHWWVEYAQWERTIRSTGVNTLARRMAFFKSVWNDALRRKLTTLTPMEFLRFPQQETFKVALTEAEIEQLATVELEFGTLACTCRDVFLFQFWAQGLRASDALLCETGDVQGERLAIRDLKTGKPHLILMHPRLEELVGRYLALARAGVGYHRQHYRHKASLKAFPEGTHYLFPLMSWRRDQRLSFEEDERRRYRMIESKTRTINHYLSELARKLGWEKKLSTHIARHSFARLADEHIDDKRVIQTMLNHANLTRTVGYLEKIRTSAVDRAVEKIYGRNVLKSDSEKPIE